jgi:predicted DNA-binding transcriptional regulator AlpA
MTTAVGTKCLTLRQVAALFNVTPPTVRAWVRAGRFPPPLGVSPHKLLWSAAAVERALLGRTAGGGGKVK